MGRYTTFLDRNPEDVQGQMFEGLNSAISGAGKVAFQKKLQEQEQKKKIQQAIDQSLLTAALKNMQLRKGTNLGQMDTSQGMQGILGQIPGMFEKQPITPQTSISISERPYTELLKAGEVASRTPEEYYGTGMATGQGKPESGWFFGLGNKGYVKDEKGNVIKSKPIYSKYNLSPEATAEQAKAKAILGNPYKTTKRISYKGDVADTADTINLPDPSNYEEGTIILVKANSEDDTGNQFKLTQGQWVQITE